MATVDDFNRPRYLYQLTPEGEAAEAALATFDATLGRRGQLQAVALEDIRLRLLSLREVATGLEPDAAVAHSLLRELTTLLDGLAGNASAFMSGLQRTIDLQEVEEAAFLAYKDRLVGYLDRFIGELVVKSAEIGQILREIDDLAPDRLLELAAQREAADATPEPGEPVDPVAGALDRWRARWVGLHAWFVGDRAHPSQAALLRQRARAAIPALLATVGALQDRRARRSDRSADFRTLARWFAQAPTDADAHRLWRAAFGLAPARHLTLDAATVTEWDRRHLPGVTPWAAAPPLEISPRLRATGRHQRRGAPSRVRDRREARAALADLLAEEPAGLAALRARLATGVPTRLSALGRLEHGELDLLLSLLGDAIAAGPPGSDGVLRASSADGTLEITVVVASADDVVEVSTADGVLLLGVTYKPNISDQRESPAGPLARALGALGAKITYQDPHVHDWAPGVEVVAVADIEAAVVAADLVVLVQNHREYDVDALARSAKRFLDTRGVTTVPEAERL